MLKLSTSETTISIIIINYNRAEFLERCFRSCVDQVIFNKTFEIIFVDDGSSDNSWKISKKFSSSIKSFRLKKNFGIPYASNYAIKKSTGKFIIRVDSDDYLNKHAINTMSDILNSNPEYSFICCDHFQIDELGFKEKIIKLNNIRNIKNHGAGIMFRKKILKKMNFYNTKMREAEDYELINKILKKGYKYFYLPLPLYRYYKHNKNISNLKNRIKYINRILKK